jgi:cytochrome o ubiquinol oxidase operon protein cyoD
MSSQPHEGSVRSYIIGFILSIEFTAIPYAMLVNHTVSGNALWATLLGFGVLQMLVQVIFFLHLGRGPKPFYNVVFYVATVSMILVVTGGSVFIMHNLRSGMASTAVTKKLAQDEGIAQVSGNSTGACQRIGANHKVIITGGKPSEALTVAKLCDTLTFVNEDQITRDISFGKHPQQDTYGGETELSVTNRRPESITLNEPGTYMFHDHNDPTMTGIFSVSQ